MSVENYQSIVRKVRDANNLEKTIRGELKESKEYRFEKRGDVIYATTCPFQDHDPVTIQYSNSDDVLEPLPFRFNPERRVYHCFGCGEGGDVIDFIQQLKSLSYTEALSFLADKSGINVIFEKSDGKTLTEAESENVNYWESRFLRELMQSTSTTRNYFKKEIEDEKFSNSENQAIYDFLINIKVSGQNVINGPIEFTDEIIDSMEESIIRNNALGGGKLIPGLVKQKIRRMKQDPGNISLEDIEYSLTMARASAYGEGIKEATDLAFKRGAKLGDLMTRLNKENMLDYLQGQ